jgi:hypothetical protein
MRLFILLQLEGRKNKNVSQFILLIAKHSGGSSGKRTLELPKQSP